MAKAAKKPATKKAGKATKKPASKKAVAPAPAAPELRSLALVTITADPALQPRDGGSPAHVIDEYAEAITEGVEFPPMVVYEDASGSDIVWWLSEGFTRYAAYQKAGKIKAKCEVRKGTRADALLNSCGSNRAHGLRRSNEDKRRAVGMLLAEFPKWSDRKVADAAGVHHQLAGDVRKRGVHPEPEPEKVDDSSTPSAPLSAPPSSPPPEVPPHEIPGSALNDGAPLHAGPVSSSPPLELPPAPVRPVVPIKAPPMHEVPMAPPQSAPASEPPSSPASHASEQEAPRDQLGRPLTGGLEKLVEVFECREAVRLTNKTASGLIAELKELDTGYPVGGFLKRRPRFTYDTERIAEFLRLRVAPFCVCPCCDAEDAKCPTCGGKGWLARAGYEQLHPAAAEKARALGADGAGAPDDTVADRMEWNSAEWAASGRDSLGNMIPPKLRDDFACDDLLEDLRDLKRIAFQMSEGKGALPWLKPEAHEVLAQAIRYVEDSVPFAVCVGCNGRGCSKCLMAGYHPKWSHDSGANNSSKKKAGGADS